MWKNLFDTCVVWSCVTRCRCGTTSSTLFTVYALQHNTGKEGGKVLNQREEERGNRGENRSQSWVENTNMTYKLCALNWGKCR
jgi:hypothetical protein